MKKEYIIKEKKEVIWDNDNGSIENISYVVYCKEYSSDVILMVIILNIFSLGLFYILSGISPFKPGEYYKNTLKSRELAEEYIKYLEEKQLR
jgi:hypothetical protein